MNPFYIALPYDDLALESSHEAEASKIVPWYWKSYTGGWSSTCKGKWLTIHYRGKVCYAQWEDVGPFHNDDWQYVFKGNAPKPNPNGNAGIEVSPAVRDFLGIRSGYRVAWKFVEQAEVPEGPWNQWHITFTNSTRQTSQPNTFTLPISVSPPSQKPKPKTKTNKMKTMKTMSITCHVSAWHHICPSRQRVHNHRARCSATQLQHASHAKTHIRCGQMYSYEINSINYLSKNNGCQQPR